MTNDTTAHNSTFTVLMHSEIGDAIDNQLSPMDGAIAVAQIHDMLPKLHRPTRRWWPWRPLFTRLYHGRLSWADVGFSYIQIGSTLHVVDGWRDWNPRSRVDIVLSDADADEYMQQVEAGDGGVSVITVG